MRIDSIEINNFRGVRNLVLEELGSTIIVAGANGSGKSCIFDAIRLLKSAYGGYQQNEWHHWMAEFQINFANNAESFNSFFQDKSKRLSIKIEFRLHANERAYLKDNGEDLVRTSIWRLIAPEMYGWSSYRAAPMASQYRVREPEVAAQTKQQWTEMLKELGQDTITGELWAESGSELHFRPSKALEILFSSYAPGNLGLIDYHGAQRMYTREQVSGVNLDLTAQEQQNKQSALYNYNSKYTNVKSEMAASYIKELLAEKAGVPIGSQNAIATTLKELFQTFFPDKEFLGLKPTADGALSFPVKTASGAVHDLNELSAGEKEVLFGYLRIRNSAPRYSLILIDEPELHLNPRLIRGLPQFYHQHLGIALDNQIWLITHSDTLLREVVGRPEYSVFHMVGIAADLGTPQIERLNLAEDIQRAVISLVGDIAAYKPGKKIVIFEGGGDSEVDLYIANELFPELTAAANVVASGNKLRVRELHDVLERMSQSDEIPFKVFSITDKDSEFADQPTAPRYVWDRYHIENYLIEPKYVLRVLKDLASAGSDDEQLVYDKLRDCAAATLPSLVRHELVSFSNDMLVSSINLRFDPTRTDIGIALSEAIGRSMDRLTQSVNGPLEPKTLGTKEFEFRARFQADLATDVWKESFRGRDILKEFAGRYTKTSYETLRDLIIARMKDDNFKPDGMKKVFNEILAA